MFDAEFVNFILNIVCVALLVMIVFQLRGLTKELDKIDKTLNDARNPLKDWKRKT